MYKEPDAVAAGVSQAQVSVVCATESKQDQDGQAQVDPVLHLHRHQKVVVDVNSLSKRVLNRASVRLVRHRLIPEQLIVVANRD